MDLAVGEVDGVPAQRHQFDRAQAVPIGQQHLMASLAVLFWGPNLGAWARVCGLFALMGSPNLSAWARVCRPFALMHPGRRLGG
jgi:hypothetical protein